MKWVIYSIDPVGIGVSREIVKQIASDMRVWVTSRQHYLVRDGQRYGFITRAGMIPWYYKVKCG